MTKENEYLVWEIWNSPDNGYTIQNCTSERNAVERSLEFIGGEDVQQIYAIRSSLAVGDEHNIAKLAKLFLIISDFGNNNITETENPVK